MATEYEITHPVLGREQTLADAQFRIGSDCIELPEPLILNWYISGVTHYVFHIKYYSRRGVCFSHVHHCGSDTYKYCTLSRDSVIKSEDGSMVWSWQEAANKGVDFFIGFVDFIKSLSETYNDYVELDDIVL